MRSHVVALAGLTTLLLTASVARADDACAEDRKKLCADAKGRKGVMACMKSKEAELSEGCKTQRAAMKEARDEVHKDCAADMEKHCKDQKGFAAHKCLKSHEADLSAECKDAIAKRKELAEKMHPGCKEDVKKHCADVKKGDNRLQACLESHLADLSAGCKSHVEKHAKKKAEPAPAK